MFRFSRPGRRRTSRPRGVPSSPAFASGRPWGRRPAASRTRWDPSLHGDREAGVRDPREDDFALVDVSGARVDVLCAEEQLARPDQVGARRRLRVYPGRKQRGKQQSGQRNPSTHVRPLSLRSRCERRDHCRNAGLRGCGTVALHPDLCASQGALRRRIGRPSLIPWCLHILSSSRPAMLPECRHRFGCVTCPMFQPIR